MKAKKAFPLIMLLLAALACEVERIPDPTFQAQQEEFFNTLTATYATVTTPPPGSDSPTLTVTSAPSLIEPSATYTESPIPTATPTATITPWPTPTMITNLP